MHVLLIHRPDGEITVVYYYVDSHNLLMAHYVVGWSSSVVTRAVCLRGGAYLSIQSP